MTPHKHAAVIKAWADGAEIQCKGPDKKWHTLRTTPYWILDCEYRVKPEVVKYRRFLWQDDRGYTIGVLSLSQGKVTIETRPSFVRWIDTEWQEVEV